MGKAIIIGATSGIGKAIAIRLLEKGWTVGISGRRPDALEAIASQYERAFPQQMDITNPDAVATLDSLLERVGPPDLFLHVSGVGYQNPALDEDKELLMVRTNCEGMVRIVTHFINYVKSSGEYSNERKAQIGVVTSVAGTAGLGVAPAWRRRIRRPRRCSRPICPPSHSLYGWRDCRSVYRTSAQALSRLSFSTRRRNTR